VVGYVLEVTEREPQVLSVRVGEEIPIAFSIFALILKAFLLRWLLFFIFELQKVMQGFLDLLFFLPETSI